jgi:hypothetical protein
VVLKIVLAVSTSFIVTPASSRQFPVLFANVFFPQLRMILDKRLHEPPAFGIIDNDQLYAAISQIIFRLAKRAVFAD